MADRDVALQPSEDLLIEDAREQAHLAMADDGAAVRDRDARRLLPAMLQGVKTKKSEPRDIEPGRVDPDDAARFVQRVASRERSLLVEGSCH